MFRVSLKKKKLILFFSEEKGHPESLLDQEKICLGNVEYQLRTDSFTYMFLSEREIPKHVTNVLTLNYVIKREKEGEVRK